MLKICNEYNNIDTDIPSTQCGIVTVLEEEQYFEISCVCCQEKFDGLEEFIYHYKCFHWTTKAEVLDEYCIDFCDMKEEIENEDSQESELANVNIDKETFWQQDSPKVDEENLNNTVKVRQQSILCS